MSPLPAESERVRKILLVILALGISALFLWMISEFLLALLFAALLSGLFYPLYRKLRVLLGGRRNLASATTILLVLLLVIIPLLGFLSIVLAQSVQLAREARPLIEEQLRQPHRLSDLVERFPELQRLEPYRDQLLAKAGEVAGDVGSYAVAAMTAAARGTATFFFMLFVMLYAMFFFLVDGKLTLRKILFYLPLAAEDENRMLDRFVSVTRATIKGTLVIGAAQGALAGVAFWVAGIKGAAFWGTLMAVLSVLPGIGAALVWIPAVVYLALVGRWGASIGLFAWCAAVVGTIDNLLRPWLVGKDTKMPDLLILLSTLGGIVLFGASGIVIGPIVGALFLTIWDLYGTAFQDVLPEPDAAPPSLLPPPIHHESTASDE